MEETALGEILKREGFDVAADMPGAGEGVTAAEAAVRFEINSEPCLGEKS